VSIRDEPKGVRGRPPIPWAYAAWLYAHGYSCAEICRRLGCTYRTVTNARARFGWPLRRPEQSARHRAWVAEQRAKREAA